MLQKMDNFVKKLNYIIACQKEIQAINRQPSRNYQNKAISQNRSHEGSMLDRGKDGKDMKNWRSRTWRLIKRNWQVYLFLLPAVIYIALFSYLPMYGIQIAFRRFNFTKGIWGSEWVGLKWFKTFIDSPRFWTLIKNTLSISLYSMIVGFPLPIMLALKMEKCWN